MLNDYTFSEYLAYPDKRAMLMQRKPGACGVLVYPEGKSHVHLEVWHRRDCFHCKAILNHIRLATHIHPTLRLLYQFKRDK